MHAAGGADPAARGAGSCSRTSCGQVSADLAAGRDCRPERPLRARAATARTARRSGPRSRPASCATTTAEPSGSRACPATSPGASGPRRSCGRAPACSASRDSMASSRRLERRLADRRVRWSDEVAAIHESARGLLTVRGGRRSASMLPSGARASRRCSATAPGMERRTTRRLEIMHRQRRARLGAHQRRADPGRVGGQPETCWAPSRTSPSASRPRRSARSSKSSSGSRRRWRPSAASPAAWRTTSTTCSPSS